MKNRVWDINKLHALFLLKLRYILEQRAIVKVSKIKYFHTGVRITELPFITVESLVIGRVNIHMKGKI